MIELCHSSGTIFPVPKFKDMCFFVVCPFSSLKQDCHDRAWQSVRKYLETQIQVFAGSAAQAESTILPAVSTWIDTTLEECTASGDNFSVVLFLNCPTCGIMGTDKKEFFVTAVTNLLNQFRRNAVAFLILPNRAGQNTASRQGDSFQFPLVVVAFFFWHFIVVY